MADLTAEQWDALASLLRMSKSRSGAAARAVLVDGATPSAAATDLGITPQAVSQAVSTARAGIRLCKIVAGDDR